MLGSVLSCVPMALTWENDLISGFGAIGVCIAFSVSTYFAWKINWKSMIGYGCIPMWNCRFLWRTANRKIVSIVYAKLNHISWRNLAVCRLRRLLVYWMLHSERRSHHTNERTNERSTTTTLSAAIIYLSLSIFVLLLLLFFSSFVVLGAFGCVCWAIDSV